MVRIGVWVCCAGLLGCGPAVEERFEEGLRGLGATLDANGGGTAGLKFDVLPGEAAMLITALTSDPMRTHVRALQTPDRELAFDAFASPDSSRSKTNGGYVASVASLNWPVTAEDPGLVDGPWRVELGLVDGNDEWASGEIAVDILLKEDADLTGGELHASIVYADGAGSDPAVVAATEEAIAIWAELYDQLGIELTWDFYDYGGGDLEPPAIGSPEAYEEISAMTPLRTVNLVIAPYIVGYDDIYGISGDIPGPLVSTGKSAVLVSLLLAAGPDGKFSAEEQRLYGETMAHEAGHYLGLFHPVEADFESWDALADTPECATEAECIQVMGRNLMFPFPVCGFASCTAQDELTAEQGGVANRHVVVY